jgi:NhaA family Na+:H+ antiporter
VARVRLRIASLPQGANWLACAGVAVLGGIGFTMALFIAGLAFPADTPRRGAPRRREARILLASAVAGVAGMLLLGRALPRPAASIERYIRHPSRFHALSDHANSSATTTTEL